MAKHKSYSGIGRDHPAVKPLPTGGKGDSGFTRFGRDVLRQVVPTKGRVPKMGRDIRVNKKMP